MKAAVYTKYGSPEVVQLMDVEQPSPKENEILIRIRATAVNSGDVRMRKADPFAVRFIFGLLKPRKTILGTVYSGVIEQIGKQVTQFKVGDVVFGHTDMNFGAHAQYIAVPENSSVALKPLSVAHTQAAVIPFGGVTALHFLKKAGIKPNQKVLVVGASGAVGSAAVQLAKASGAIVTGVCSTANMDLVTSIGADKVIDYTKEDFTQNGEVYDVIMDTVNTISVSRSLKSLSKNGIMILSAAGMTEMMQGKWISATSNRQVLMGVIAHSKADIVFLKQLIDAGKYKAVIDKTYSLSQIADAHAYVEQGHKKGNVAVEV
mgnify:FL=1